MSLWPRPRARHNADRAPPKAVMFDMPYADCFCWNKPRHTVKNPVTHHTVTLLCNFDSEMSEGEMPKVARLSTHSATNVTLYWIPLNPTVHVGFFVIVSAILFVRHYLQLPVLRSETSSQVDPEVSDPEVEPFPLLSDAAASTTADSAKNPKPIPLVSGSSTGPAIQTEKPGVTKLHGLAPSRLTRVYHDETSPDPQQPVILTEAHETEPGPSQRRAVHEEDAEDIDVLPPMYREAWGERHQMQLQEGASGVARDANGSRAVDEVGNHSVRCYATAHYVRV
ncbi:hypothetical protein A1Q1_00536 [Trichosporon asahii var. asahii CBS 2479]|uniref:Uncharacterized protein n=1 Tax=Trichosporon asahii var. asahii (strain ATCC 90039 / CBS 2479 / JCM 2466 / KCTC 7840 / NBRC 103889/ NCYC 2677 / UAMH 7654) TaxID=1186058 RepID=J4UFR6_TRIAS|nr:hypothetical protein A1Q1_00536 [Trichosporon asahii var. asahii CBS 2479]EJT50235.1 hypothetical protein A1Q1_00536 [Trichosporon asahii var. asahii CBS 2479]